MNAETFALLVAGHRRNDGAWWDGHCPAHDDARESLSFRDGDRRLVVRCHAGCSVAAIAAARNLRVADFSNEHGAGARPASRVVAEYEYRDERGELLYVVERREPKTFRVRRPDGRGGWIWNLDGVRRVLYRLPELMVDMQTRPQGERVVHVPEGERDVERLRSLGLPATTNAGGAGKWRDEYTAQLRAAGVEGVVVLRDNDRPGDAHAGTVARSCVTAGLTVRKPALPGLPPLREKHGEDISDWLDAGHTRDELAELVKATPALDAGALADAPGVGAAPGPWEEAQPAPAFIAQGAAEPCDDWLEKPLLARGAITHIFAPRGVGKSLVAIARAVALARAGHRVLYLDRDNPPRVVRERMRAFGAADTPSLRILTRSQVPPLTDARAWVSFPYRDYDLVVIDSLDSSTEGVGEQDSARPSRAIAVALDIARRAAGPAFLIPGNTTKGGTHGRGSGVIEDRADIVFEVRDATGFTPSGGKPWWLELPPAGRDAWGERAARRKRRTMYRLAFVPSKTRGDEEPEPFVYELDLSGELWSLRDATADMVNAGEAAREHARQEAADRENRAAEKLADDVRRRETAGEERLVSERGAVPLLVALGLTRKAARALLAARDGRDWRLVPSDGRSVVLAPADSTRDAAQSDASAEAHEHSAFVTTNCADRMDTGRRNPDAPNHTEIAPARALVIAPRLPLEEPIAEWLE